MSQEDNSNILPSRFRFGYCEKIDSRAIMYKDDGEPYESFSWNIPEGLVIQRMVEIRDDENMRNKLIMGTSLDPTIAQTDNGIITDLSAANIQKGGFYI
jgi:hypothetical protein